MTLYYITCDNFDMLAAYDGMTVYSKKIGTENRKRAFSFLHSIPEKSISVWKSVSPVPDFGAWLNGRDYIEFINI